MPINNKQTNKRMNFFTQFFAFYDVIAVDLRLKHYHISLYITILYFWNKNRLTDFIILNRDSTLKYSKIGSNHTYYNSLRDLHNWGYIEYFPKQMGERLTKIKLIIFEYSEVDFAILDEKYGAFMHRHDADMHRHDADMHSLVHQDGAFMHSISADMHPFSAYLHPTRCISASLYKVLKYLKDKESIIKNCNFSNSQNAVQNPKELMLDFEEKGKRKKIAAKKENDFSDFPTQSETIAFFESNNSSSENAQKFYNYYSAIGWVTKSNIPIVDWQSAAKTWISNQRVQPSNTKTNYEEAF